MDKFVDTLAHALRGVFELLGFISFFFIMTFASFFGANSSFMISSDPNVVQSLEKINEEHGIKPIEKTSHLYIKFGE